MVTETETSEVAIRSTAVWCFSKISKIRRRNPYARSMREELMLISVMPFLQAMAFSPIPGTFGMMQVPASWGRKVFFTQTGMPRFTAGWIVDGWITFAPK